MIRAVLFDLDNTLVDFIRMKHAGVEAAVAAMADAGLPISEREAERRIYEIYRECGIEYQEVFDRFLEMLPDAAPRLLAAAVSAYRMARNRYLQPYPGVRETLVGLLKRGVRLGVVSDAPRKQAWLRLVDAGLEVFFDAVVAFEDTGKVKPNPEPFRAAMALLGAAADETLMVGDWPERDLQGAAAIGVTTVFVRYGGVFDTARSGADYEIESPRQLLEIVDRQGAPHPLRSTGQLPLL